MVNGLEKFKKHFAPYRDQYVLIGGTACTIIMQEAGLDFRATKDLDIVLYIEALHKDFFKAFWQFIEEGGYKNKQQSQSKEIFYRFSSPSNRDYPAMLELFSRLPKGVQFSGNGHLTPIPIDETIASLSAILLDEDYYYFIHQGKLSLDGLSILNASHLIPIKARAHIDLTYRKKNGENVDERDVRKHKNDIIRLFQLLSQDTRIKLPPAIQNDFKTFLDMMKTDFPLDYKSLGLKNTNPDQFIETLKEIYGIPD